MSLLSTLTSDASINTEKDSVGGSFAALESGLQACTITMAYLNKAASGALGLVLTLKTDSGQEIKSTQWMTSGTAKGGKNYYEKDGEKNYLPGYIHANSLCLLTVGKEISEMDTETKVIGLYSHDAKAEVPTKVEVVMDLLNKDIIVGLIKQTVDKTRKNEVTGVYEATGETRDENEIEKLFRASDNMTITEIRAQAPAATFIDTWSNKWTGVTKNKSKGVGKAGVPGVPGSLKTAAMAGAAAASTNRKPVTSLFAA